MSSDDRHLPFELQDAFFRLCEDCASRCPAHYEACYTAPSSSKWSCAPPGRFFREREPCFIPLGSPCKCQEPRISLAQTACPVPRVGNVASPQPASKARPCPELKMELSSGHPHASEFLDFRVTSRNHGGVTYMVRPRDVGFAGLLVVHVPDWLRHALKEVETESTIRAAKESMEDARSRLRAGLWAPSCSEAELATPPHVSLSIGHSLTVSNYDAGAPFDYSSVLRTLETRLGLLAGTLSARPATCWEWTLGGPCTDQGRAAGSRRRRSRDGSLNEGTSDQDEVGSPARKARRVSLVAATTPQAQLAPPRAETWTSPPAWMPVPATATAPPWPPARPVFPLERIAAHVPTAPDQHQHQPRPTAPTAAQGLGLPSSGDSLMAAPWPPMSTSPTSGIGSSFAESLGLPSPVTNQGFGPPSPLPPSPLAPHSGPASGTMPMLAFDSDAAGDHPDLSLEFGLDGNIDQQLGPLFDLWADRC